MKYFNKYVTIRLCFLPLKDNRPVIIEYTVLHGYSARLMWHLHCKNCNTVFVLRGGLCYFLSRMGRWHPGIYLTATFTYIHKNVIVSSVHVKILKDRFSLGCVKYHFLTSENSSNTKESARMMQKHVLIFWDGSNALLLLLFKYYNNCYYYCRNWGFTGTQI